MHSFNKMNKFRNKNIIFAVIGLIVIIGIFVAFSKLFVRPTSSQTTPPASSSVYASRDINKEFSFPVSATSTTSDIKFVLEKAELSDEIIVKGQKATAANGRTFLTINLKITNSLNKAVQINTRDYVRLSIKGNDELLAPDIHNDPVEVQAISTKYSRIGFPVNDGVRDFVIHVGEIKGEKQEIEISLQ